MQAKVWRYNLEKDEYTMLCATPEMKGDVRLVKVERRGEMEILFFCFPENGGDWSTPQVIGTASVPAWRTCLAWAMLVLVSVATTLVTLLIWG